MVQYIFIHYSRWRSHHGKMQPVDYLVKLYSPTVPLPQLHCPNCLISTGKQVWQLVHWHTANRNIASVWTSQVSYTSVWFVCPLSCIHCDPQTSFLCMTSLCPCPNHCSLRRNTVGSAEVFSHSCQPSVSSSAPCLLTMQNVSQETKNSFPFGETVKTRWHLDYSLHKGELGPREKSAWDLNLKKKLIHSTSSSVYAGCHSTTHTADAAPGSETQEQGPYPRPGHCMWSVSFLFVRSSISAVFLFPEYLQTDRQTDRKATPWSTA